MAFPTNEDFISGPSYPPQIKEHHGSLRLKHIRRRTCPRPPRQSFMSFRLKCKFHEVKCSRGFKDDPEPYGSVGEQSNAYRILLRYDRKIRHRRIKKQRRYERLAATSQFRDTNKLYWTTVCPTISQPCAGR